MGKIFHEKGFPIVAQPLAYGYKSDMIRLSFLLSLLALLVFLPGCEVIGGIFKAGVWVGILTVVAILALIFWLVSRMNKK